MHPSVQFSCAGHLTIQLCWSPYSSVVLVTLQFSCAGHLTVQLCWSPYSSVVLVTLQFNCIIFTFSVFITWRLQKQLRFNETANQFYRRCWRQRFWLVARSVLSVPIILLRLSERTCTILWSEYSCNLQGKMTFLLEPTDGMELKHSSKSP